MFHFYFVIGLFFLFAILFIMLFIFSEIRSFKNPIETIKSLKEQFQKLSDKKSQYQISIIYSFSDAKQFDELDSLFSKISSTYGQSVEILCITPQGEAQLKGEIEDHFGEFVSQINVKESDFPSLTSNDSLEWLIEGTIYSQGQIIVKGEKGYDEFIEKNIQPDSINRFLLVNTLPRILPIFGCSILGCSKSLAIDLMKEIRFFGSIREIEAFYKSQQLNSTIEMSFAKDDDQTINFSLLGPLVCFLHFINIFHILEICDKPIGENV